MIGLTQHSGTKCPKQYELILAAHLEEMVENAGRALAVIHEYSPEAILQYTCGDLKITVEKVEGGDHADKIT